MRTTTYTYTATDELGDTVSLTFTLTVEEDLAPTFAADAAIGDQLFGENAAVVFRQDVAIEPLTLPEATGGDGDLTYALTPELPRGLVFDPATRTLSGTPAEPMRATRYTYTATDADETDPESVSLVFWVTVEEDPKPSFAAGVSIADKAFRENSPIEPLTLPEATGGDGVLTYALTPQPPAGLVFDPATRTLDGTPSEPMATTEYTYTRHRRGRRTRQPDVHADGGDGRGADLCGGCGDCGPDGYAEHADCGGDAAEGVGG